MITAIDSNVILDVLGRDPEFALASKAAIEACAVAGSIVACEVVWAETAGWFRSPVDQSDILERMKIAFSPLGAQAAHEAGRVWKRYREAGGHRGRLVSDALIGGHALLHADRLLTRDRGFYRDQFTELEIVDPAKGNRSES